ncbi:MAG TPA: helix-turn-helix domain-containing protein [Saprospiraceae bacterium]|nr:helix-turn-helix domain-containing protein [Saprospiraceae bacterium]
MNQLFCIKCQGTDLIKSGIVKGRQRYKCKQCEYSFTVLKDGKAINPYYVIKALQLYIEGISTREIERILGVSHVSVLNWVKKYKVSAPENYEYRPSYKVLNHKELIEYLSREDQLKNTGFLITEIGDKFILIKWERFKK